MDNKRARNHIPIFESNKQKAKGGYLLATLSLTETTDYTQFTVGIIGTASACRACVNTTVLLI